STPYLLFFFHHTATTEISTLSLHDALPISVRGNRVSAAVWALDELAPGLTIAGPAILAGRDATALVEPGWRGTTHPSGAVLLERDRKSTRLNSSHVAISYAVFCLKKKKKTQ